jgi:hypothetical protein
MEIALSILYSTLVAAVALLARNFLYPLTARARLPFNRSFVAVNPHDLSYCSNERTQRPEVSVERDGEAGGLPLVAEFSTWNLYNENFVRIKTSNQQHLKRVVCCCSG